VLTEYDGEVKATEDKAEAEAEEVKKQEMSRKKLIVKHRLQLRKILNEEYGGIEELKRWR
jgi:hypothetical protein